MSREFGIAVGITWSGSLGLTPSDHRSDIIVDGFDGSLEDAICQNTTSLTADYSHCYKLSANNSNCC